MLLTFSSSSSSSSLNRVSGAIHLVLVSTRYRKAKIRHLVSLHAVLQTDFAGSTFGQFLPGGYGGPVLIVIPIVGQIKG